MKKSLIIDGNGKKVYKQMQAIIQKFETSNLLV